MAKGFNRPSKSNPQSMMEQIQKLQEELQEAQERLADEIVTGSAGGGAVKVSVTGDQKCTTVEIDPSLLEDVDAAMLQDLLLTAFNSALDKSREMAANELGPLASGLPF